MDIQQDIGYYLWYQEWNEKLHCNIWLFEK